MVELTPVIVKERRRPTDYNGDESSSSSFYSSSFLYKSSDSSCNPDQKTCEVSSEVETQMAKCLKDVQGTSRSFVHFLDAFLSPSQHLTFIYLTI